MADAKRVRWARGLLRWTAYLSTELAGELALRMFTTPRRIPRPYWESEIAARGEPRLIQGRMMARFFGPVGAPAVIFLHGWEGRGLQFGLLIEPLLSRGFRVIAIDGPAHGDSPGRRTNLGEFARGVAKFAEELRTDGGRVACLVGHSFGAGVAAVALIGGAPVERAVLVAAPSSLARVADFFARSMGLSPAVTAAFRRRLNAWTGLSEKQIDLAVGGASCDGPVLIAHDPADRVVDFANAKRFVENWPQARLRALEGVGHFKILKAPEFIAAVLEFLGDASSPRKSAAE